MTTPLLQQLADVLDGHRWSELSGLLHPSFHCVYVHTRETFDGPAWVRLNVDYPGFQRFILEDLVVAGDREAGRAHVTTLADTEVMRFEVASFIRVEDGLIREMTEVWTDVADHPSRPASGS